MLGAAAIVISCQVVGSLDDVDLDCLCHHRCSEHVGLSASLLVSAPRLANALVEVTGEVVVGPEIGFAFIAGAGSVDGATIEEIGGQLRAYLTGSFRRGLLIGTGASFVTGDDLDPSAIAPGAGFYANFVLGWKLVMSQGFTMVAEVGGQFGVRKARADQDSVVPLLDVELGWSF